MHALTSLQLWPRDAAAREQQFRQRRAAHCSKHAQHRQHARPLCVSVCVCLCVCAHCVPVCVCVCLCTVRVFVCVCVHCVSVCLCTHQYVHVM